MALATTNYLTPTGREEAWRFTPLSRLSGLHDASVELSDRISLSARDLPTGARLEIKSSSEVPPVSTTDDLVIERVREVAQQVLVLTIDKNSEISEPIFLHRKSEGQGAEVSRVQIQAGSHSQATIVVENVGRAVLAEEIEIVLEPGANIRFITLQEWENTAVHIGRHHAIIGKDATFTSYVITVGGSVVRLLPTVEYSGPGSSADLYGLYFATDNQHLEHRIHVEHKIPNAKSRVNYKGALSGESARTVWIGDVFIKATAEGTDTYELNRNLLLSDGARADSVPNLEIETGEIVGAGHASTTGRFDDEQLFYLQSRGIPAEEARRLVIRGFFAEIVAKLKIESIEERIMNRIDAELEEAK
jgi:Fe-S cluster assembly protein SufD